MHGFTPEPLEEVGNRSIEEIEAILKSMVKYISFTSVNGEVYYQIDCKQNGALMLAIGNGPYFGDNQSIFYRKSYSNLAKLLEAHPLDLSRFEISN